MTDTTTEAPKAPQTRSQQVAADVAALLRSRHPLLWIVTQEEARVERYVVEACAAASYTARTWDCGQGFADIGKAGERPDTRDVGFALNDISEAAKPNLDSRREPDRGAWIMRDLAPWLGNGMVGVPTCRQLRNLARTLPGVPRERAQAVIVLTPSSEVPAELQGHATVIEWPRPDRAEIAAAFDAQIGALSEDMQRDSVQHREASIDAAIGLTGLEAQGCFAKSIVQLRRIDPAIVAQEKKRLVAKIDGLEWFDPLPGGLDAVGGLDELKAYLVQRAVAWSPEARAYGLPLPVGALVAGHSGCGKSLTAKAIGTAWECPVLRIDMGAFKSKFVGDSEQNLRRAFEIVAALGRCVVWFDEIEKAMAGASQGAADGGVSSDALGFILTWLQEKRGEAFAFATCNKVDVLPPELLRRFDTLWMVDLPTVPERAAIVRAAIKANGLSLDAVDVDAAAVAKVTAGYNGDQVARLVPDAMYRAFGDGRRPIRTDDLLSVAADRVPFSETAAEAVGALRAWAKGRARYATKPEETAATASDARQVDL